MPRSLAIEQMAKLHLSKVRVVCVRSSLWSCEQTFFALLFKANETRERYPHTKKANWCCTQFQCTMFPFMSYILNLKSLVDRFFFKSSMWPTEKNLLVKASQQLWVCQGRFQGAVVGADLSWRESDTSGIEVKVIKHWRCFQVIG